MLPIMPAAIVRVLLGRWSAMVILPDPRISESEAAATGRSALPAFGGAAPGGDLGFRRRRHLGHVLVALRGEPQRVVAELDRRIFRWVVDRLAGRQALDDRVVVGIAEERDGVAHGARDVAHAVRRRQEA